MEWSWQGWREKCVEWRGSVRGSASFLGAFERSSLQSARLCLEFRPSSSEVIASFPIPSSSRTSTPAHLPPSCQLARLGSNPGDVLIDSRRRSSVKPLHAALRHLASVTTSCERPCNHIESWRRVGAVNQPRAGAPWTLSSGTPRTGVPRPLRINAVVVGFAVETGREEIHGLLDDSRACFSNYPACSAA